MNQVHLFWAQRVLSLSFAYMKKKKKPEEIESVQRRIARPAGESRVEAERGLTRVKARIKKAVLKTRATLTPNKECLIKI